MQSYHVHISPKTEGFHLNLKEVWEYRDLVALLTKKTFTLTYKQTILGPAWVILNPLLSSLAYMIVFGFIAHVSTGGVPQILFYLFSTAIWGLFSYILNEVSGVFVNNANLFGKVYFPRLTVPISTVLVGILKFLIQLIAVAVPFVIFTMSGDIQPRWGLFLTVPLAVLHICILSMGIGVILSSFTTKYRDLRILVSFGLQLLMYGTPIVYPMSQLDPGLLRTLVSLNPMSTPVEWLRYVVLGSGTVEPLYLGISIAVTLVCAILGIFLFNHVEKTFIDTV